MEPPCLFGAQAHTAYLYLDAAIPEQKIHDSGVLALRGDVDGAAPVVRGQVEVGPVRDERLDHRLLPVEGGNPQRGGAVLLVGKMDSRPISNEQRGQLFVTVICCME